MNSIKTTQGKDRISNNTNNKDTRTQQTSSSNGVKANNTNNTSIEINNDSSLYSRELSQSSISNDDYATEVTQLLRLETLEYIQLVNQVLKRSGKSQFSIQVTKSDPIEKLMFQAIEGCSVIGKYKLGKLYAEQSKNRKSLTHSSNIPEAPGNACICWMTFSFIFQNYFISEPERDVLLKFKSIQNSNDIIVQDIDSTIKDAIKGLEKIKNECYFSIFRFMADPSLDLISKALKIATYTGSINNFSKSDLLKLRTNPTNLIEETELKNIAIRVGHALDLALEFQINKMASYISRLQILLDCLIKIKQLPKTVHNLRTVYAVLSNCHSFSKQDMPAYKLQGEQPSPYWRDYFRVKTFLLDFSKKIAPIINDASNQQNALDKKLQSTNQNNLSNPQLNASPKKMQNKKLANRQVKKQEVQKKIETPETNKNKGGEADIQHTTKSTSPLNNSKEDNCLEKPDSRPKSVNPIPLKNREVTEIETGKEGQEKNEMTITPTKSIESATNTIILDEDDFDNLEIETNALMEALLHLFDKDRAAKLELKKAKLNKAKLVIDGNDVLPKTEIQTESIDQLLNTNHQKTIEALFQAKPGHLIISGKDAQNLIIELGGKSLGNQGSKFQIYWNGSNKKAGEYEITHGGDRKGYLTSEYASRIADAIHTGIKYNCIAKELFPQTLLALIESHVILSNG